MARSGEHIDSMEELLLHGLKDIYYTEEKILKSLPKMIDKALTHSLSRALRSHLQETETHVARLDQVFAKLGHEPQAVECPAIDGLISEGDEIAGEVRDANVRDHAIIGAAQSIEHYEIARYGTLIALAEKLGHHDIIHLLSANLDEEKAADEKLTALATRKAMNRKYICYLVPWKHHRRHRRRYPSKSLRPVRHAA
jgi:ferritin-like metal-binding protein YciE